MEEGGGPVPTEAQPARAGQRHATTVCSIRRAFGEQDRTRPSARARALGRGPSHSPSSVALAGRPAFLACLACAGLAVSHVTFRFHTLASKLPSPVPARRAGEKDTGERERGSKAGRRARGPKIERIVVGGRAGAGAGRSHQPRACRRRGERGEAGRGGPDKQMVAMRQGYSATLSVCAQVCCAMWMRSDGDRGVDTGTAGKDRGRARKGVNDVSPKRAGTAWRSFLHSEIRV